MEKRGGNRTNIVVSAPVQKELMTGIEPVTDFERIERQQGVGGETGGCNTKCNMPRWRDL